MTQDRTSWGQRWMCKAGKKLPRPLRRAGNKAIARQTQETVTCHRPPAVPPCPPDAPHRARPSWRDLVGETGTWPEPLGPAPQHRHQSSRNRLSRLVPGTGTAPLSRGAANEKPACPPPQGALAADLFTLPEVERPLSASCALLEPYYNIFASES